MWKWLDTQWLELPQSRTNDIHGTLALQQFFWSKLWHLPPLSLSCCGCGVWGLKSKKSVTPHKKKMCHYIALSHFIGLQKEY